MGKSNGSRSYCMLNHGFKVPLTYLVQHTFGAIKSGLKISDALGKQNYDLLVLPSRMYPEAPSHNLITRSPE